MVEEAKEREVERVKVERVKVENELVEKTVTTTRNDVAYYKRKVAKEMAREKTQHREEDSSNGP